jgi:nucleolar protein 9
MPRENQKRGRRAQEKKRKHDEDDEDDEPGTKRHKSLTEQELQSISHAAHVPGTEDGVGEPSATPFYGMLDEDEQRFFKEADDMLELNSFQTAQERDLFLASVYREADGKELKIANSQSCSRLLERLILVSNSDQLKSLFQKFNGQYVITPECI